MQTEMARTALGGEEVRVDTLAIVSDPQSNVSRVIAEFHFDLFRLGVSECIAQGLASDPVELVTHDRAQVPRRALHLHMQSDRSGTALFGRELVSQSRDGLGQVIALDC